MSAPLTLTVDLDLDAYLVRFHGFDGDGNERVTPQTIEDVILERAAQMLAERAASDRPDDDDARIQRTNNYGEEQIIKAAQDYLTRSDSFDRKSPVQKFIADEVERAFKNELTQAMAASKAQVLAAINGQAAQVVTDTITKMAGIK